MEAAAHPWPALGALLLRDGLVTKESLDEILAQQRDSTRSRISGKRLGEALVDRGVVTEEQIARLVAEQYELPYVDLDQDDVTLQVAALLPEDVAQRLMALPVSALPDDSILVAVADPASVLLSDELRRNVSRPLRFAVTTPDSVRAAIATAHAKLRDPGLGQPSHVHSQTDHVGSTVGVDEPHRSLVDAVRDDSLRPPLGAMLIREGLVSEYELDAALAQQRLTASKRLGELLVERAAVTRGQVARLVAEQYELPFLDLGLLGIDGDVARLLPEATARRLGAVPVSFTSDGSLIVAVGDPTDALYADDLRLALDVPLEFAVADPDEIGAQLDRIHAHRATPSPEDEPVDVPIAEELDDDSGFELSFEDDASDEDELPAATPPEEPHVVVPDVVRLRPRGALDVFEIEELVDRALALGATDIHFSPRGDAVAVRVRLDEGLRELATLNVTGDDVSAVLMHLAGEDSYEAPLPFEGQIVLDGDATSTSLRLIVLPTTRGEVATLHVLSAFAHPTSLDDLGLTDEQGSVLRGALGHPSGLVVVCGPTASGRSTTLYAALRELNSPERALATIEESIGQVVDDVDQIEMTDDGITPARAMRAVLLSDHDVVLIGNLEDADTAQAALRAAVSGRFVLAGLQAPGLSGALHRLAEVELDQSALGATLRALVGQRLLRRVCGDCREPYYAPADELAELERPREEAGMRLLARGGGCVACGGTGFRGNVAVFELLVVTDEIRALFARGASPLEIEHAALSAGMQSFREAAIRLCLEGVTTVSELRGLASHETTRDLLTDLESSLP